MSSTWKCHPAPPISRPMPTMAAVASCTTWMAAQPPFSAAAAPGRMAGGQTRALPKGEKVGTAWARGHDPAPRAGPRGGNLGGHGYQQKHH